MERLFVFGWDRDQEKTYRGYYDGVTFVAKAGYCEGAAELMEYDTIEIYGMDGFISRNPKRFNKNILKDLDMKYISYYGEQTTLF